MRWENSSWTCEETSITEHFTVTESVFSQWQTVQRETCARSSLSASSTKVSSPIHTSRRPSWCPTLTLDIADTGRKSLNLLGTIDGKPAIITAEKTAFNADTAPFFVNGDSGLPSVNLLQKNDIYHWFLATVQQSSAEGGAGAKVNLIYPCTDVHVRKYSAQQLHMVVEPPQLYKGFIKRYIEGKVSGGRLNWVYNILEHREESEKIVFEDPDPVLGFILLPDLKWDLVTLTALYLSAIVHRSDIRSVRDLTPAHLPFLRGIRNNILTATSARYGVAQDQLKIYAHYQPSYYHFHLHVVHVAHDMGGSATVGKAILLDEIIQTLEVMKAAEGETGSEWGYRDVEISYLLGEEHDLWTKVFQPLKEGRPPTL
ncbi:hypothetical protein Dda_6229 [Drechslerella dactyloides]|uniref:Scavenger mRNA decapping enzyme n=1 Tax=Drechslerella dactyloides TaxID=74499 RepID=A0AAD6NIA8_DREDA|nr:hypothetical protein Dda_6229 [Drechslerella dactyloides]